MFEFLTENVGNTAEITIDVLGIDKKYKGDILSLAPNTIILKTANGKTAINISNIITAEILENRTKDEDDSHLVVPSLNMPMKQGQNILR